jgi:uncharacterized protein YjbI with pentapeptide repeats
MGSKSLDEIERKVLLNKNVPKELRTKVLGDLGEVSFSDAKREVVRKLREGHYRSRPEELKAGLKAIGNDLSWAILSGAQMGGLDLSGVKLAMADLSNADLTGTRLARADLSVSNMSNARLMGAELTTADLSMSDCSRTDFTNADLSMTNMRGSMIAGANFTNANLSMADLSDSDLTNANFSGATTLNINVTNCLLGGTIFEGTEDWTNSEKKSYAADELCEYLEAKREALDTEYSSSSLYSGGSGAQYRSRNDYK